MRQKLPLAALLASLLLLVLAGMPAAARVKVTSPKEQFGFNIGDDYQLVNYARLVEYWRKLDRESDRLRLEEMGKTAEGRTLYLAVITAPENGRKLPRCREISRRLARAEGLADAEARALAAEGRAVVWIDGGLHANEVLGAQQLIELVYQMVSGEDPETRRILKDVVLLACLVNPDGMDLVSDWYMREPDSRKRSLAGLPRLYQKYIGHDNNRDFYMSTQPETEAINRVFYDEWFPQIVYNHHQSGPPGTVLFAPPFRDPFNHNLDPLVPLGIDQVGAAMHARFVAEGKPGATMRSGANYSTWWNGGLRTTVYFHNMIGLLTETIGSPTPMDIPFIPRLQLPRGDLPYPITPGKWHFRQSVDYSMTANRAVLDLASRHREQLLYNSYRMGRNSIERGSRDHWTVRPRQVEEVAAAVARDRRPGASTNAARYFELLRRPERRDPRGYILPADQPDFLTATRFVNALIKTGITVHRAAAEFKAGGKTYPEGSYVVRCAQAFRPHILDMFEPQDHPDDIPYPGGPPTPPYDSAGYTLALQMGVRFDRILDAFDGPFEPIDGLAKPPAGWVTGSFLGVGYLLSHETNDAFRAVNRLLAAGDEVYWLAGPITAEGRAYAPGAIYIPGTPATLPRLQKLAAETGLRFQGVAQPPSGPAYRLRPIRIGLWDRYGGSMPSGWTRWLLEQFEFPFRVVYPKELDEGELEREFDVLLFPDGAIPARDGDPPAAPRNVPAEYQDRLGRVTVAKTVPRLRRFLEAGGSVLCIGGSTVLGQHLGLPVASALTETLPDGRRRPLPREKYYVPGSLLEVAVDNTRPLAFGLPARLNVFFNNSPVFRLNDGADTAGLKRVAWFDSEKPLVSGWAWGQPHLNGGSAVLEAPVGQGRLFLFGPEIAFRAQPHGTFKLLFNGLYCGSARPVALPGG